MKEDTGNQDQTERGDSSFRVSMVWRRILPIRTSVGYRRPVTIASELAGEMNTVHMPVRLSEVAQAVLRSGRQCPATWW